MARTTRAQRPRSQGYRRRGGAVVAEAPVSASADAGPVPAPRVTAPAQRAATPVTTKITTTDYGYVVGELRRIAMLTVVLLVILFGFWLVLG